MTCRALESEVETLNAEVTRLRLMVQRCVGEQERLGREIREQHSREAAHTGDGKADNAAQHVVPQMIRIPQPDDPVAVLPSLFSGMDGTARLFKVLMETYPWLLPPELREAQEELERKRGLASQESRGTTPQSGQKRGVTAPQKRNSPVTAPEAHAMPLSSDSSDDTHPSLSHQHQSNSDATRVANNRDDQDAITRNEEAPPSSGSVSPRPSGAFSGLGSTPAVLGLGRRGGSVASVSPKQSPTSLSFVPAPRKTGGKASGSATSILSKIKRMGGSDDSSDASSDKDVVYAPGHKRRTPLDEKERQRSSSPQSDQNSFVDETMKPSDDEHDF